MSPEDSDSRNEKRGSWKLFGFSAVVILILIAVFLGLTYHEPIVVRYYSWRVFSQPEKEKIETVRKIFSYESGAETLARKIRRCEPAYVFSLLGVLDLENRIEIAPGEHRVFYFWKKLSELDNVSWTAEEGDYFTKEVPERIRPLIDGIRKIGRSAVITLRKYADSKKGQEQLAARIFLHLFVTDKLKEAYKLVKDATKADEVIAMTDEILKINPHSASGWHCRGWAYIFKKDYVNGYLCAKKATEYPPKISGPYINMLHIALDYRLPYYGIPIARDAAKKFPDHHDLIKMAARVLILGDKTYEAIKLLDRNLGNDGPCPGCSYYKIWALCCAYRWEEAEDLARRTKDRYGVSSDPAILLAQILTRKYGDAERAKKEVLGDTKTSKPGWTNMLANYFNQEVQWGHREVYEYYNSKLIEFYLDGKEPGIQDYRNLHEFYSDSGMYKLFIGNFEKGMEELEALAEHVNPGYRNLVYGIGAYALRNSFYIDQFRKHGSDRYSGDIEQLKKLTPFLKGKITEKEFSVFKKISLPIDIYNEYLTECGIGLTAYYKGDFEKAEKCLKKAVKTGKWSTIASEVSKRILEVLQDRKTPGSMIDIREYLRSSYWGFNENSAIVSANAYYMKGSGCLNRKQYGKAIENYTKAIKVNARVKGYWICRGETYRRIGKYKNAIADCTKAIELDPAFKEAYSERGRGKNGIKDYRGAIADFSKVIELDPRNKYAYDNRGYSYRCLGEPDMAVKDYRKAIEIDPKYMLGYRNLAFLYSQSGKFEKAIEVLDEGLKEMPDSAPLWERRGSCKLSLGRNAEAIKDYDNAIKFNPSFYAAYIRRATARFRNGDGEGAVSDLDAAIKLQPKTADAYNTKARFLFDTEKYGDAKKIYTTLVKAYGTQDQAVYALLNLCVCRIKLGESGEMKKEAVAFLEKRKQDDWPGKLLRFFAGTLDEESLLKQAETEDKQRTSEQNCEAYYYIARSRLARGEKAEAVELLKKCIGTGCKHFVEYQSAEMLLKEKGNKGTRE
ncbi:MAG: tetratricopeptide repeat protein [Planctomycetota bacterium]|nr:MAG: tetratricopeptide repeat protein [Planctomycetota bacterium]